MKQHTIIFVPHARAKFRKWRLTSLQAWTVIGTLGALTLGGLVAMVALLNTSVDRQQLDELQAENATLREINLGFESSIRNLEGQVEDYQQRIHKLAIVAGISDLAPGGDAGIGGTSPSSSTVKWRSSRKTRISIATCSTSRAAWRPWARA